MIQTLSTLTNDTYVTLGFVATKGNTTDKVEFFINRKSAGTTTSTIPTANMKIHGDESIR